MAERVYAMPVAAKRSASRASCHRERLGKANSQLRAPCSTTRTCSGFVLPLAAVTRRLVNGLITDERTAADCWRRGEGPLLTDCVEEVG